MPNALRGTLAGLLERAEQQPGSPQRINLLRGLRVDVLLTVDAVHVQLSRLNVYPSQQEWSTVMRAWPFQVPTVTPKQIKLDGRFYLKASWSNARQTALLAESA